MASRIAVYEGYSDFAGRRKRKAKGSGSPAQNCYREEFGIAAITCRNAPGSYGACMKKALSKAKCPRARKSKKK